MLNTNCLRCRCCVHSGECSFASGTFTADVASRSLGTAVLGYVVAVNKIFSTSAALFLGKLSDKIGRYPCFVRNPCLCVCVCLSLSLCVCVCVCVCLRHSD